MARQPRIAVSKPRKYSDEAKAQALSLLAANSAANAPLKLTSDQLQIPDATLSEWSKGRSINDRVRELLEAEKASLASIYEQVATLAAIRLKEKLADDAAMEKTALVGVATTAAIAVDKLRLLRGESTAITEQISSSDRVRADELFRQAIEYFDGDKEKALALLREKAPTLASLVVVEAG
jgi:hypothetical protein